MAEIRYGRAGAGVIDRIEPFYTEVFGPARFEKASYQFRRDIAEIPELTWVATLGDHLLGAVKYWPISVGPSHYPALLLGPLGVQPGLSGRGIGSTLIIRTLNLAALRGHRLVLLVGPQAYYQRFGFVPATPLGFTMPGESHAEKLQVCALRENVLDRVSGRIYRQERVVRPAAARIKVA